MWTHLSPCPWNPNRMYNKGELPFAAFDQETINEWLLDYAPAQEFLKVAHYSEYTKIIVASTKINRVKFIYRFPPGLISYYYIQIDEGPVLVPYWSSLHKEIRQFKKTHDNKN